MEHPADARHFTDDDFHKAVRMTCETPEGWEEPDWIRDLMGLHCELRLAQRGWDGFVKPHVCQVRYGEACPVELRPISDRVYAGRY